MNIYIKKQKKKKKKKNRIKLLPPCTHIRTHRHTLRTIIKHYYLLKLWMRTNFIWELGEPKVSCNLRHRGVQLRLAFSWTRHAILAAGKGRGGCFYFFCFLTFIHLPFSPVPLFHPLSYLFYLSSPFSLRRHKMTHKD